MAQGLLMSCVIAMVASASCIVWQILGHNNELPVIGWKVHPSLGMEGGGRIGAKVACLPRGHWVQAATINQMPDKILQPHSQHTHPRITTEGHISSQHPVLCNPFFLLPTQCDLV